MKINESAYSSRDTWTTTGIFSSDYKMPSYKTFSDGISKGFLDSSTAIDPSICFYGIRGDSDLLYINSGYFDGTEITVSNSEVKSDDKIFYTVQPWGGASDRLSYSELNADGYQFWHNFSKSPMYYNGVAPLLTFPFNKIILLIQVVCATEDYKTINTYTLKDYKDDETKRTNYPNIIGFQCLKRDVTTSYGGGMSPCLYNQRETILGGGSIYSQNLLTYYYIGNFPIVFANKNFMFYGSPERWETVVVSGSNYNINGLCRRYIGSLDEIYKQISYFGFAFTDNVSSYNSANSEILTGNNTDENIYKPVFDEKGYLYGEYVRGEAVNDLIQNAWNDVENINPDFNPSEIPEFDKNEYTDIIIGELPKLTGLGSFCNVYALSSLTLASLSNYMWYASTADDVRSEFLTKVGLMGDNPINAIVSLNMYPFDVATTLGGNAQAIAIGYNIASDPNSENTISGYKLDIGGRYENGLTCEFDLGSIYLSKTYFNFLDFEPYTAISLYIPFCGWLDLTPSQVLEKNISVKIIAEVLTGTCTGIVYIGNTILTTKKGSIAINVPVSGVNSADYAQSIANNNLDSRQNIINMTTQGISAVANVASGNIGGLIGGVSSIASSTIDRERILTNREYIAPTYSASGGYSANNSIYLPLYAYLQITHAVVQNYDSSIYGNTIGYACNTPINLSNCTGYSVFSDINTNGLSASEIEKRQIYNLLTNGVYL